MLRKTIARQFLASTLLITAAISAHSADLTQVLGAVNGDDITLGEVLALDVQLSAPPAEGESAQEKLQRLVDQVAIQKLLAKSAEDTAALNYRAEAAARIARANAALEAHIASAMSEEYLQSQYDEAIGSQPDEPEWNASHILVASKEEAKAAIARIEAGEDFAELAKELSSDPGSGSQGGGLGWFGRGQMVPEFESAAAALEKGAISEPVQSQFGWHVLLLNDQRTAPKPSLEEVRPQLEEYARQILVQEYVTTMHSSAQVTIAEDVDPAILDVNLQ